MVKGEGKTIITLVPERRILLYVLAMAGGVILAAAWPDAGVLTMLAAASAGMLSGVIAFRGHVGSLQAGRWHLVIVFLAWICTGLASTWWQLAQSPPAIEKGVRADFTGVVARVDGRIDERLRIWLRVEEASRRQEVLEGHLVRLSVQPDELAPVTGSRLRLTARIYPPPPPVMHGARDHGVQARVRNVVASGYVVAVHHVEMETHAALAERFGRLRQARADEIAAGMPAPAGGIAAALLIGDRRYVDRDTYDLFRRSGLAHLLAISGLHMGLLCFGVVGLLRAMAALFPQAASRLPVHKYAAVGGMIAGLAYVLLSGMSVSAIRAFLMAMLVLAAWLSDRLGLTLRNVGLAAGAILLVNPVALFSAGFQLSFAATTALVVWFEGWRHRSRTAGIQGAAGRAPRLVRWAGDLVLASILASAATLPLTAQHFGTVTPWGVLANLAGIPLTGLWIMPAGLGVLLTQFLPAPDWLAGLALLVMQRGIQSLVFVAGLFADLPLAPLRVPPPGAPVLAVAASMVAIGFCLASPSALSRSLYVVAALALAAGFLIPERDAGILLGRGSIQLVLAGQGGTARLYTLPERTGRNLSGFYQDSVARQLAQPVDPVPVQDEDGAAGQRHLLRDGRVVTVVTRRRDLSAACRSDGDLVIALVAADYPCRSGVPLFSLAGLQRDNYLLRVGGGELVARATSGQYFRISPVSRP